MSILLKTAQLFQSGMVLQQNKPIQIWGDATPGSEVTVQIQGKQAASTAGADGSWRVELPSLNASECEVLRITAGSETITYTDIAIGEVFVASGQSNMEFFMRYEMHKTEILNTCANDRIRFYDVPKVAYFGQNLDFDYSNVGIWRKANPDNLDYFSAVGYYFARTLEQALDVPVGIIGCSWGGTSCSSWMRRDSAERLQRPEVTQFEARMKEIPECDRRSYFSSLFVCDQGLSSWNPLSEFGMPRTPTPEEYAAFFAQSELPYGEEFANLVLPEHNPGSLFEHMVQTIAPVAVSGVLWYQGESDDREDEAAIRYAESLEAVITDWRTAWNNIALPFFLVQLPGFRSWAGSINNFHYTAIRADQQRVANHDENVYLCSISDVGEEFDIHPKDKKTVGERLALLAEKYLYGINLSTDAPLFAKAERNGDHLTVTFCHGSGLHIVGDRINALEVYADGIAVAHEVTIEENRLVIQLKQAIPLTASVEVHYAQSPWYKVNLYNDAGLPAFPFKADI